jgi:hypothetical protein
VIFDSIANPKNLQLATDWSAVLFHLISSGILSTDSRYYLAKFARDVFARTSKR